MLDALQYKNATISMSTKAIKWNKPRLQNVPDPAKMQTLCNGASGWRKGCGGER